MTNLCRERLNAVLNKGTKNDKMIADKLLKDDLVFTTISSLVKKIGISSSTIHRFSQKIGYPSFKHFLFDYNSENDAPVVESNIVESRINITKQNIEMSEQIAKQIKGKMHIITSRRTRGIGRLISDQLNIFKIEHAFYAKEENSLEEFISHANQDDTIILITLSGDSLIISNAIGLIAQKKKAEMPNVVILTGATPLKIFSQYAFMDVVLLEKEYDFSNWKTYIESILELIKVALIVVQKKYSNKILQ